MKLHLNMAFNAWLYTIGYSTLNKACKGLTAESSKFIIGTDLTINKRILTFTRPLITFQGNKTRSLQETSRCAHHVIVKQ